MPSSQLINNVKGYVYLLREREFLNSCEYTYKIGRTSKENPYHRVKQYPNGSEVIAIFKVDDNYKAEKLIKSTFNNKFERMRSYGLEYYNGDPDEMQKIISNIVEKINNMYKHKHKKEDRILKSPIRRYSAAKLPEYKLSTPDPEPLEYELNTPDPEPLEYKPNAPDLEPPKREPDTHTKTRISSKAIVTKYCVKCDTDKPTDQFGIYNRNRDGLRNECKQCTNQYARQVRVNAKKKTVIQKRDKDILITIGNIEENYHDIEKLKNIAESLVKLCDDIMIEREITAENSVKLPKHILSHSDGIPEIMADIIHREFINAGLELDDNYDMVYDMEYVEYDKEYIFMFRSLKLSSEDISKFNNYILSKSQ